MRVYSARRAGRTYTIAQLLGKQPKSLQRNPAYATMMSYYGSSPRLRRLRISARCYSLLQRATVAPGNLHYFYRTYRLPADPFFSLFFAIKRSYLADRERMKLERKRYITGALRSLPEPVFATIRYLGYLERHFNAAGRTPVWWSHLYPGSKRNADRYRRNDASGWLEIFRSHLVLLSQRYRALGEGTIDLLLACYLLGITPEQVPPTHPSTREVNRRFRELSMLHHPDRGGDPATFIEIKRARDLLAGGR